MKVFLFFLVLRLLMAVLSRSWHVPDETWQSVEIAHRLVFGAGHQTWEWREGIRSYLHPLVFVPGLYALKATGLDGQHLWVVLVPRLTQGCLSALGDAFLVKTSQRLLDSAAQVNWFVFLYSCSWFINYCSSRTLVNTLELTLSNLALYHFSWALRGKVSNYFHNVAYVSLIGLSFQVRPTTAIFWLPLVIYHAYWLRRKPSRFITSMVLPAAASLALGTWVDSHFYGELTCVPWNFFRMNVMNNIGSFYGTHPWHWYLSQGLGVTLTLGLIPFGWSLKSGRITPLRSALVLSLLVYSALPHKEFRFILPLIPTMLLIATECFKQRWVPWSSRLFSTLYVVSNVVAVIYLSMIHQTGNMATMQMLGNPDQIPPGTKIWILMPCHSTPMYSHLHRADLELRFLTCEPPLGEANREDYIDEADRFYLDPHQWIDTHWSDFRPDLILIYDQLQSSLAPSLAKRGYRECHRFFHAHFADGRVGKSVLLYCL